MCLESGIFFLLWTFFVEKFIHISVTFSLQKFTNSRRKTESVDLKSWWNIWDFVHLFSYKTRSKNELSKRRNSKIIVVFFLFLCQFSIHVFSIIFHWNQSFSCFIHSFISCNLHVFSPVETTSFHLFYANFLVRSVTQFKNNYQFLKRKMIDFRYHFLSCFSWISEKIFRKTSKKREEN